MFISALTQYRTLSENVNIMNHWFSGLLSSSGNVKSRKDDFLETGCVFIFKWAEGDILCWNP